MGLPAFEKQRQIAAEMLGTNTTGLAVIALILAMGLSYFVLKRLSWLIVAPVENLANHCKRGHDRYAIEESSQTREEDILRRHLENQSIRISELTEQLRELEGSLRIAHTERERAERKEQESERLVSDLTRMRRELSVDNETLKAARDSLKRALEEAHRSRIEAEAAPRSNKDCPQTEKAISIAAAGSLWTPGIVKQFKTLTHIINGLARNLSESWEETSLSRIRESIKEIRHQSEQQIALIQEIETQTRQLGGGAMFGLQASREKTAASSHDAPLSDVISRLRALFPFHNKDIHYHFEVSDIAKRQIVGEDLKDLIRSLLDIAEERLVSGKAILGVGIHDRHEDQLSFALEMAGDLADEGSQAIENAQHNAQGMGIELHQETLANDGLRLSFLYARSTALSRREVKEHSQ